MKKTTTYSNALSEKRFHTTFIQLFLFIGFLFGVQNSFAQKTWDGGGDGTTWASGNNWNPNGVPASTDNVTIGNGFTVALNTSTTVASLTVGGGTSGQLTIGSGNTNYSLTVSGAVTINSGATITAAGNGGNTLNIGGNLSNAGTINDNAGDSDIIFNGATQTISGTGTFTFTNFLFSTSGTKTINSNLTVNGNWTNNGGTVGGTGTVTFAGSGTIGGSSTTAFPNLTISASGTIVQGINTTVSGNFNKTSGTYNISSSSSSYSLGITGNFTNSGGGFRVSNGANNSTLNVGGTFGLSAGTFILENSASATGATVNVTGATTISGTGVIIMDNAGSAATCSFNANDVTFSGTGGNSSDLNRTNCSLDFGNGSTVNHAQFKIAGNFVHSSTNVFYTSSTTQVGSFIFNKSGTQTLSYSGTNSQYFSMTVNSGSTLQLLTNLTFGNSSGLPASTFLINGTLDAQAFVVGGASTAGEIFTLSSGATLITANTNGVFSGTVGTISNTINRTFNAAANYVFDGTSNQTANLGNASINNLTISNTGGSITLNAAITATGNVLINNGASLTAGNLTHLIAGNWTLDSGTFVPGTGTITLNGTSQTVGGTSSAINFNNLILSGGTKTFNKQLAVSGNLSIASGALANPGSLTTHTANTLTLGGLGTTAAKFGSTSTSGTAPVYKNNTYFTSGTTGYITVGTGNCTAPTITFGTIPSICNGANSLSLPYNSTTGAPDLYSIAGSGITSVTNGTLATAPSSITVALSSPAAVGTISSSAFTVSSSVTGCVSNNINGSVTVNANVGIPNFTVGATTVCQNAADTTYTATASDSTGITYSVLPAAAGTIGSSSGIMNWNSTFSGTATITASAAGCAGPITDDRVVTVTPTVGTPSTPTPSASTICQASAPTAYTTSATNATSYTWTVTGTGNSISGTGTTGTVTWSSTFTGSATVSVRANGCNGPSSIVSTTVNVTATVGNPSFTAGSTSVCQNAANTTYTATATNNTGITYSVLPAAAGTIGSSNGIMDWDANYSGSATITATVTGCNGPKTVDRVVTVTATVGTPNFTAGALTVCQNAANTTYTATATDATAISYSVSPVAAGTIGSSSGIMDWSSTFSGTATITASAAGCNGPKTNTRVVTVTPTVGATSFTSGPTTVCQNGPNSTYTATATNTTGITYSVTPLSAGEIDPDTGEIDWDAFFSGSATITALAAGCNGPTAANRVVTVTPTVGTPIFSAGATTVCQDAVNTTYTASASNSTGITYSVSPPAAGTIGSSSGIMDWNSSFNGTATITASAAGCNGPKTADRLVVVNPTVGTPGFTTGATEVCQDAPDETYTAGAPGATGITYSISPVGAGTIGSSSGIVNWNANFSGTATITATAAGCNGPKTADRIVTVNALPVVTASDVSGCSGSSITLSGSGTPIGGSGSYSVSNPFVGTSSTTYTYTYTDLNGCTNTSSPANITITPQPVWYLDADGDQYYTGTSIASCTSPGAGYTTTVLGGNDCNDNDTGLNPGATDICYNNIDENCNGIFSDGCAPVVVNMTASYHNTTLPSMSTAIPAVSYSYPGTTNIKYRFSIKNITTNTTAPDIIQTSRYVTIPASIHSYNSQYTIKASAVINEEVVAYAGNTITVNSPTIQLVTLSTSNCGATLASLTSTISANPGLNATGYTFRIRLNDSNPTPTYAYSQSATRFVGANSFTGFPLQYSTSYKVSVQYTSTDASTNSPVQSGYGAECVVNTPSIPLISLASPSNNTQVAAINANISAQVAAYSTSYQFRIRASNDNGPTPTYYYSVPNPSRFSSLTAFQGITFAYNTNYEIAVQYSVIIGSSTVWSGYGPETKIKTPFFPVTSLIPSQCGLSTPTPLTQQLNISPYPGFPHYKVLLEEIAGEDVVNSEEREIAYSHFKLSDFSIAQEGKSYAVSVAIKLNGVFGDYDTACDLFTASNEDGNDEGGSIVKTILPFKATAYPNPFANNFMLDVKTASQSTVNIKVYDMIGRLMEQMNVTVSDMRSTTIGNNYPSGVYNVVVSQENDVETVRVVKR